MTLYIYREGLTLRNMPDCAGIFLISVRHAGLMPDWCRTLPDWYRTDAGLMPDCARQIFFAFSPACRPVPDSFFSISLAYILIVHPSYYILCIYLYLFGRYLYVFWRATWCGSPLKYDDSYILSFYCIFCFAIGGLCQHLILYWPLGIMKI